jgi:hypothetical protein
MTTGAHGLTGRENARNYMRVLSDRSRPRPIGPLALSFTSGVAEEAS